MTERPEESIQSLEQSLEKVEEAVHNHPLQALRFKPSEEKWSVQEVVCHLLDCERFIFSQRVRRLIAEVGPNIPDIDHLPWVKEFDYMHQDFFEALEEFRAERYAQIAIVKSLPAQKWNLSGRHATRGAISLRDVVNYCAEHTMTHVRQIERTLEQYYAKQSTQAAD
jgi:hypothetical protein